MSEFGTVVGATEKALTAFALGEPLEILGIEIEDDPGTGTQHVTLDGWVRIADQRHPEQAKDEGNWGLYVSSGDGKYQLIDSDDDPVEIVKAAVVEVISGRIRDVLNEVLA